MADFWSRKLGTNTSSPPPAQTPPPPPPAQSGPWWQSNMPQPQQVAPQQQQVVTQQPLPGTVVDSRKASHTLHSTGSCPACDSENYFKHPQGGPNMGARCYDCGYPLIQSASGDHLPSTGAGNSPGQVQAARQIAPGVNNYNPQTIVGRVS